MNKIYVWPGYGYRLDIIETVKSKMTIEEVAFRCIKESKGYYELCAAMDINTFNEYMDDEMWVYCDMSEFGLCNLFLTIENMRCEGVEVHS